MESRTLVSRYSKTQRAQVWIEQIREGRWGCLWRERQQRSKVDTLAYNGRQINVSEDFNGQVKISDCPRSGQTCLTTSTMTAISRRCVCGIVLVCRLWQLLRQLDEIDHESILVPHTICSWRPESSATVIGRRPVPKNQGQILYWWRRLPGICRGDTASGSEHFLKTFGSSPGIRGLLRHLEKLLMPSPIVIGL